MTDTSSSDIRSLRLQRRTSQRELADFVGVTQGLLSRWERGFAVPTPEQYALLAQALGTSAAKLARAHLQHMHTATPGEGYTTAQAEGALVHERRETPPSSRWRVLDVFCGCGGLSYGFEQSGHFAVTAGLDLLSDRVETFRANHPYASTIVGDVRSFSASALRKAAGSIDVIVGGPPCQGFSSIRPFRTLTEGDPRNTLIEEFVLLVGALKPSWFLFENVVGMLTHQGGRQLTALLEGFREAGYTVDWRIINMAFYGLPQTRERLVIVGNLGGAAFRWPPPTHQCDHRSMAGKRAPRIHVDPLFARNLKSAVTAMEAIHDLPVVTAGESARCYRTDVEPTEYERAMRGNQTEVTLHEATSHSEKMLKIIRLAGTNRYALPKGMTSSGFSSCYSRLEPDRPSVTLTVNFVHPASNKCIHPYQHRALTPREGARLQGFPDWFEFKGNRAQVVKQIGNAVPPLLGKVLAEALANALGDERRTSAA